MKTRILDSWAVVEWILGREPSAETVQKRFADAEKGRMRLFMSAINAGEVYYSLRKSGNESLAQDWLSLSNVLPVTIDVPTLDDIWSAATLKGRYAISYADAFAATLALRYNCPLMTGDREFRVVEHLELEWLGSV
ncbi:MAG: type II toxin-antitoxin system VapC family toxin [Acidobacteriota bacterium]